jgi:hypothetical protein
MDDDCLDGLLDRASLMIQVLWQASEIEGVDEVSDQSLKLMARGRVLLVGFLLKTDPGVTDLTECEQAGIIALTARKEAGEQ